MADPRWLFEPSWNNSGFRNSQGMGISEHFEMPFTVPPSSIAQSTRRCPDGKSPGNCVDYLYSPSDDNFGMTNGMWGLLRAYDPTNPFAELKPLPVQSNPLGSGEAVADTQHPRVKADNLDKPGPVAPIPMHWSQDCAFKFHSATAENEAFTVTLDDLLTAQQTLALAYVRND